MKPPYTIEEILCLLESARMDDVSDRLRELWAEMLTDNSSRWNASLRQDIRNLTEENDTLRTRLADLEKDVIKRLSAGEHFDDWPEYHAHAMGCGLEDRDITNRYEAMQYGWDECQERMLEQGPFYTAEQVAAAVAAERNACAEVCDDVALGYQKQHMLSAPPPPPGFYQKSIAELLKEPDIKPGDLHK